MLRTSRWLWVPLFVFLTAPNLAAQNKKKLPKKPLNKKNAENKLVKAGVLVGEVTHVEPAKQSFRLKVTYSYAELNAGAAQGMYQAELSMARAQNAQQLQQAQQSYLQHQSNLYTLKTASKDIPIDAAEKVVVRLLRPKQAFDDMGNVKKLTRKELAKLRGKDRLFDGEFSDVSTGQIIQVTLMRRRIKPGKRKLDLEDNKPKATRIVILRQPKP